MTKLNSFEVAGYQFERVQCFDGTRYDHILPNGDRLIVMNSQSLRWKPENNTRWTAYLVKNGDAAYWQPLLSAKRRKRYFGTPDIAAGQALREWVI